jgi:maleylpyruvate isomerase
MKLYTYFRSSSAYRVRIALNLKGIAYEPVFVNIRRGEQRAADYLALNPQGLVPMLVDGKHRLTQSVAILEYLEETHPELPLLPAEAYARARVRSLAQLIACDIQPLNNTRVLGYLETTLKHDEEARTLWYRHWIAQGFEVIESQLDPAHRFCCEESPTFADICLVAQVYNALRYGCNLQPYPKLMRVYETCAVLPPFRAAAPENQPDAQA